MTIDSDEQKAFIPLLEFCKARKQKPRRLQPYSKQRGGQRMKNFKLFWCALVYFSGGDVKSLLKSACNKANIPLASKQVTVPNGSAEQKKPSIIQTIKTLYAKEKHSQIQDKLVSCVSMSVKPSTLEKEFGWKIPKSQWRRSRQIFRQNPHQATTTTKKEKMPPRILLASMIRSAVKLHYLDNCTPAANRTIINKVTRRMVAVAARCQTKKELYEEFTMKYGKILAYGTFCRFQPAHVRKSKRAVDKCDVCERGKEVERQAQKLRQVAPTEPLPTQLEENLKILEIHKHLKTHQREKFKLHSTTCKPGEATIVMDFKENLKIGGGPVETGKLFYTKMQITVLGFVLYIGKSKKTHQKCTSHTHTHSLSLS